VHSGHEEYLLRVEASSRAKIGGGGKWKAVNEAEVRSITYYVAMPRWASDWLKGFWTGILEALNDEFNKLSYVAKMFASIRLQIRSSICPFLSVRPSHLLGSYCASMLASDGFHAV
jgi:hypothetical protein